MRVERIRRRVAAVRTKLVDAPWLVPAAGLFVVTHFASDCVDWVGYSRAAILVVAFGAVLGWSWYALGPRPLARRLYPFVVLAAVFLALSLIPGTTTTVDLPGVFALPGVVGGLVIAERHWHPSRAVPLD